MGGTILTNIYCFALKSLLHIFVHVNGFLYSLADILFLYRRQAAAHSDHLADVLTVQVNLSS